MTLSVILITKNEAERLPRCLESVRGLADEIVVLDSGSTDATLEIARRYTDKVYVSPDWPGFGPQKNRVLDYTANSAWTGVGPGGTMCSLNASRQMKSTKTRCHQWSRRRKMASPVRPELPTASVDSSQAPTSAVDDFAPPAIRAVSTYKSGKVVQTNGATSRRVNCREAG